MTIPHMNAVIQLCVVPNHTEYAPVIRYEEVLLNYAKAALRRFL